MGRMPRHHDGASIRPGWPSSSWRSSTGCTVPRPDGASPLRYRDAVFTDVTVTSNLVYGSAPDLQGNPVTAPAGPLPARRRHPDEPPGARVGARGASRAAQDEHRAGGRRAPLRPARLRGGVDRLPPARPAGLLLEPLAGRLHQRGAGGQARRPGRRPLAARERHHLRRRPDPDRDRRRIGRRHHGHARRRVLGGHREQRQPGPALDGERASSRVAGGLPDGLFAGPGDAWGLFFHGTADGVVPYVVGEHRGGAVACAACPPGSSCRRAPGTCPGPPTAPCTCEQSSYFLYFALDLAHAAGQPVSAARAAERQARRLASTRPPCGRRSAAIRG